MALAHQHDIVAILVCGAEKWNEFRRQHPHGFVLNCASLPDAQLSKADLHAVILIESDLQGANLVAEPGAGRPPKNEPVRLGSQAGKHGPRRPVPGHLSGADLREASLVSSFLKYTDLRGSDLSTARGLTDAQVCEAFGDERTRLPSGVARPASWGTS